MLHRVEVRFIAGLNDLLPPGRRGRPMTIEVAVGTTVKDLAESLGVPHTEIAVIVVNGESVDFGHQVCDGDRMSVYPVFEALDVSPVVRLDPPPLREPPFVLDVHLGRLARSASHTVGRLFTLAPSVGPTRLSGLASIGAPSPAF